MNARVRNNGIRCLAVAGLLLLLAVYIRHNRMEKSVELYPLCETEPGQVVYFCQQDPEWAEDHLGDARDTMRSSGCLVCSLASGLMMQSEALAEKSTLETEGDWPAMQPDAPGAGFSMTAGELNAAFSEGGVYTDSGAVIWGNISSVLPDTECIVADKVKAEEIDALLQQGIFPVVKVRVNGVGAWHWVLLVGSDENGYLCMDPMSETEEPVSLGIFRNRVYSMRAVYFSRQ